MAAAGREGFRQQSLGGVVLDKALDPDKALSRCPPGLSSSSSRPRTSTQKHCCWLLTRCLATFRLLEEAKRYGLFPCVCSGYRTLLPPFGCVFIN